MSTSFGPKPLLALLLSILVVQGAYGALDVEEIDALNHLLFAFPDLAHVPSVFASAGPSWVPGFTGLCDVDDQWTYHGLMCWGGHIAVMAFTDAWGEPQVSDFSFLANLSYLKTFTDSSELLSPMITFPMIQALAPAATLGEVHLSWPADKVAEWAVMEDETSLQLLEGPIPPTFNFSKLTSLETIKARSSTPLTWDLSTVLSTLAYVVLDGHNMSDSAQMELIFEHIPTLSYFECNNCVWPLTSPGYVDILLPVNFAAMILRRPLGEGATGTFRISSLHSSTQYLYFYDFPTTNIEIVNVPGLIQLLMDNCADVPPTLTSLGIDLKEIRLRSIQNTTWPSGFPDWTSLNPRILEIEASFTSTDLQNILCSVTATDLHELTILDTSSEGLLAVPSCINTWPVLESFSIKGNEQFFADDVFSRIPPTAIRLHFDRAFQTPVSLTQTWLNPFDSLLELDILNNDMTGSIPDMFFALNSYLTALRLTNNSLEGTIPYESMTQVSQLWLDGNQLSHWPTFPASLTSLNTVNLDRNLLVEIPSDEVLWRMTALDSFSVNDNPNLQGPLPTFWANHSSLVSIRMAQCGFSGTLPPTITNLNLLEMDISSNSDIYGNLPSTPIWITRLNDNKLSGGIPATWAGVEYPVWEVQLQNNRFNESIEFNWLSSRTSSHASLIDLSNSLWDGNMFDLERITKSLTLEMSGTQLDFCSSNPDFNHIPTDSHPGGVCFFDNGAICACLGTYTSCGEGSVVTCNAPTSQPSPSASPSASPSPCSGVILPEGFTCKSNGEVEAESSVSTSQLEMPKNLGTVTIRGNLTVSTSIVLNGASTKIVVEGCITVPEGVIIRFSKEEMDQAAKSTKDSTISSPIPSDPQALLSQLAGCSNSLSGVKVAVDTPKSSCRKVKGDTSESTPSSLTVAFKLDNSGCNTKWIILGSVLGGVIVIGTIVILLLVKFNAGFRSKVLPYHGAN
jgi:hypothetical protein